MDSKQIAHDLAVAKMYGSDFPIEKLVEQYRQYYKEIYEYLKSQDKPQTAQVIQNPFR